MKNIKKLILTNIYCFFLVVYLPILFVNICYAGPVDELSNIKCRDFLFIHKTIYTAYPIIRGPYFYYEDCLVEIKFPLEMFNVYLERYIEEYNNGWDKEIHQKIKSLNNIEYRFDDFNEYEKSRLKFIFAELLEAGGFNLKEKKSDRNIIDSIRLGYYGWVGGLMEGQRGRLFFLPSGEIFFQVIYIVN